LRVTNSLQRLRLRLPEHSGGEVPSLGILLQLPKGQLGEQSLARFLWAGQQICRMKAYRGGKKVQLAKADVLYAALDVGDRRPGQPHALGDLLLRQPGLTASCPQLATELGVEIIHLIIMTEASPDVNFPDCQLY
jgi:hypothetical protein